MSKYMFPEHRDDGQCHWGCWNRATVGDDEYAFLREAYLSLADEFDPMGSDPRALTPKVEDFDDVYVNAATAFAALMGLSLPWFIQSLDLAAADVARAERREVR